MGIKNLFLEEMVNGYESYFDIEMSNDEKDGGFAAKATFYSRAEKYVLVHSAKLWAVETNEHVFFVTEEVKTVEDFEKIREKAYQAGMKEIKPHKEHMYSYITLVIINENIPIEVQKEIEKFNCHKVFLFSFHGWMDFRIAAVDLGRYTLITNKKGGEMKKFVGDIMEKYKSR